MNFRFICKRIQQHWIWDVETGFRLCSCWRKNIADEYERLKALFGGQWSLGDIFITLIRLGTDNVYPTIRYYIPI